MIINLKGFIPLEIKNENIKSLLTLVAELRDNSRFNDCIDVCKKILSILAEELKNEDRSFLLKECAESYYGLRQYSIAIEKYKEAEKITIDEKTLYFDIYLFLARCYRDKGELDKSLEYFKKVHEFSPGSYHDIEYMKVLKKLGKNEELKEFYEKNKHNPRFFHDMAKKVIDNEN